MPFLAQHFINNLWIPGVGDLFTSTDPATGDPFCEARAATPDEVNAAVEAADDAFDIWSALTLEQRTAYLQRYADLLLKHSDQIAKMLSHETGKPRWEARSEAAVMVAKIPLTLQAYHDRLREQSVEVDGAVGASRFRPHGVVAVLGPFNLPGHLPNGHIVPALLAGNTVVFKPSEFTPAVATVMAECWQEAGLPDGVFNMIHGARSVGAALVSHRKVDGLFFTGSAAAGLAIRKTLVEQPQKIVALEMGGNNPLIVHEAADLDAAAYLTIQSAFITAGQRCTCARRLIVPTREPGDQFIQRLTAMMGKIRVGPHTDDPEPFMGPVISAAAADRLLTTQEALTADGGRPIVPMKRLGSPLSAFLSPGLIDMTAVKDRPDEEVFGPLLQLIRVRDFDEALKVAKKTRYGLAAGLISDNREYFDRFYRKSRSGIINWNRQLTNASGKLPFGGIGYSGNHRPSGYFAVDYCAYPVASLEFDKVQLPATRPPGIDL